MIAKVQHLVDVEEVEG
ncbi:MAG: hypothetical protein ACXWZU_05270 [Actinomycetota bacterium]